MNIEKPKAHGKMRPHHQPTKSAVSASMNHLNLKQLNTTNTPRDTEPSETSPVITESFFLQQVNKMITKINRLKESIKIYHERESDYLNKVNYLEKENKSLMYMVEEKDKKIHEISKKSKEDKVRIY